MDLEFSGADATCSAGSDQAYEIRFLAVILGARTPAPRMDDPVIQIPLHGYRVLRQRDESQ